MGEAGEVQRPAWAGRVASVGRRRYPEWLREGRGGNGWLTQGTVGERVCMGVTWAASGGPPWQPPDDLFVAPHKASVIGVRTARLYEVARPRAAPVTLQRFSVSDLDA